LTALPVTPREDGCTVTVRVQPKARKDRVAGLVAEADGDAALKVAVTAPPDGGRANDALVRFLAKAWGVPRRSITLIRGQADRRKVLHVADPDAVEGIRAWIAEKGAGG